MYSNAQRHKIPNYRYPNNIESHGASDKQENGKKFIDKSFHLISKQYIHG